MTIIVFLVDTSASMCQRALVNGVQKTYLDIAKGAVETFLKFRQRSQDCMGDRYMLLTFEDPPNNVKAGWKENHATFMNELKNLQSNGLTSMGEALKNAFDLLNLNRMQSGIDTYGQGRCPFYLEPSVIIVLTDGGKYAFRNGVHQEIILPLHAQMPGTKLTKEPFRWDQRLFSLVLRMPGNRVEERVDGKVPHDDSMIEKMCEVTGGRSYKIKSHYVLNQCIESLVQKVQPGVVIHFDQLISNNGDSSTADLQFQSTKRMIYVPKQHPSQKTFPVGYWPIPEPYWPDPKLTTLPPRDAHPKIKIISPSCDEPQVLRNFPIDKYELEASPLTLQILSKKESNKVWPLIVSTGMQGEMPFGYLKPNSTVPIVHLYVLPYNYQMLLPLINDLFHKFNLNPPNDWVYKFTNYVKTIPQYYCPFLRRALATTPNVPYQLVQYILPENLDSYLCPAVANYLKQMKNTAKLDQENLCLRVLKQLKQPKPAYHQLETAKLSGNQQMKRDIVTHPMLKDTFTKMHMEIANFDSYTIVVPSIIQTAATKNYRNPYDIPRRDLIDEIARMRENFFHLPTSGINVFTKDSGHCLPISDMGNYQEYLKNKETPLRELEPTNVRQHMFGNPYKKDKNMVMVDEADLNDLAPMKASGVPGPHPSSHMKKSIEQNTVTRMSRKRKAGPIRKDYVFKRSALDMASSSSGSLSGDDGNMSELLTDDENSSEFSSGSDIEEDTEGCLVMALDVPEESTEANGISTLQSFPLRENLLDMGSSGGSLETTRSSAESSTASSPSKQSENVGVVGFGSGSITQNPNTPCRMQLMTIACEDAATVSIGEVKLIHCAESLVIDDTHSVDEKEQQRPDETVTLSWKKQTHEEADLMPSVWPEIHVIESDDGAQQQQRQQTPVKKGSLQHPSDRNVSEQSSYDAELIDAAKQDSIEKVESNVRPEEQTVEHTNKVRLDPTDGGVGGKLHIELTEQKDCKIDHSDQSAEDIKPLGMEASPALVPKGLTTEEQLALNVPQRQEGAKVDDYVETNHESAEETSVNEMEQSTKVRIQPDNTVLHSSTLAKESDRDESMSVDYEAELQPTGQDAVRQSPEIKQAHSALQPTEPVKSEPVRDLEHNLGETHIQQQSSAAEEHTSWKPLQQQQLQSHEQRPTSARHPLASQWGHDTNNGMTDVMKASKQQQQPADQRQTPRHQPVSQWGLDAGDMTDVMKISNILKTCHNGGDTDRDKDSNFDDGTAERSPTTNSSTAAQDGTKPARPVGGSGSEPEPVMVLANGLVSTAVNGSDNAVQPTLNWDYNFALYSCVEDEQELEQIEETNLKTRSIVFRDIRRPGRDYTQLLKHLELVQGSRMTQKHFVDMCVHEARRFRRHRMVECIQEWWAQHTGRSIPGGVKRGRSKQEPGGANSFYIYGNSDGLEDEHEHALTPDNLYLVNDTGATVYSSETFRSTTPPGAAYLNNSIGSAYGTTDFSHNNHHFAEVVHVSYPNT
ncbi:integrator complex subunit 6 [Anopheles moucheti]|uniref:integrator complex subunit 6 n=1 Tax=Anopheles moucheti TaxID=186751 RepID=UPI0022F1262F|nr:integrator complex subunit 6 [Anopheles moucheti]